MEQPIKNKLGVGWCLIPPEIVGNKNLSPNEKIVFGRINGLKDKKGYCYASNAWLGQQFSLDNGTVSNIISSLVKKGYIYREIIRNENKEVIERHLFPIPIYEIMDRYPLKNGIKKENKVIEHNHNNSFAENSKCSKKIKTINNHLKDNPDNDSKINKAIKYYNQQYIEHTGHKHPRITLKQFEQVKSGFYPDDDEYSHLNDLSLETLKDIIDSWFSDDHVLSDYNINHFTSGNVIRTQFYKYHY